MFIVVTACTLAHPAERGFVDGLHTVGRPGRVPPKLRGFDLLPLWDFHPMDSWTPPGITSFRCSSNPKIAAYNAALSTDVFGALAGTGHAVGAHLQRVQRAQDVQFYRSACDPQSRFMPHMDQAWFLRNRFSWYEQPHATEEPLPKGEAIVPYLTKVIVYDALAALGAAGQDAIAALKVFTGEPRQTMSGSVSTIHTLYGSDEQTGIHAFALTLSLQALLKGSFWATQE